MYKHTNCISEPLCLTSRLLSSKGGNSILDFLDDALMKFSNNRICFGAVYALQVLEDTPANVVIMEMDAGEMTGFELAEAIRDIDEERKNLT